MSLVPLLQPARIRDWRRRRRVEVLHETIRCFTQNALGIQHTAANNLFLTHIRCHSIATTLPTTRCRPSLYFLFFFGGCFFGEQWEQTNEVMI